LVPPRATRLRRPDTLRLQVGQRTSAASTKVQAEPG
jgi:hypothetical protein